MEIHEKTKPQAKLKPPNTAHGIATYSSCISKTTMTAGIAIQVIANPATPTTKKSAATLKKAKKLRLFIGLCPAPPKFIIVTARTHASAKKFVNS